MTNEEILDKLKNLNENETLNINKKEVAMYAVQFELTAVAFDDTWANITQRNGGSAYMEGVSIYALFPNKIKLDNALAQYALAGFTYAFTDTLVFINKKYL